MTKVYIALPCLCFFFLTSCSQYNAENEKSSLDITLQEMQMGIDDSGHGMNCLKTELQILDGKIKQLEEIADSRKKEQMEARAQMEQLDKNLQDMKQKILYYAQQEKNIIEDIKQLSNHANETSVSFTQQHSHIVDLEKEILLQNKKLDEINQIKTTMLSLADSLKHMQAPIGKDTVYHVTQGDSLEKIAKKFNVSVENLKKSNQLQEDLIVVGQEILIPAS